MLGPGIQTLSALCSTKEVNFLPCLRIHDLRDFQGTTRPWIKSSYTFC